MMKVQIENKENNIVCTITCLEYSHRSCNGRYVDAKRVRNMLMEEGHNPGLLIKDVCVDNKHSQLSGTWVFEDGEQNKAEVVVIEEETPQTPKRTSTVEERILEKAKVLDNSPKDVIIEE